jgi:hypothetical protein
MMMKRFSIRLMTAKLAVAFGYANRSHASQFLLEQTALPSCKGEVAMQILPTGGLYLTIATKDCKSLRVLNAFGVPVSANVKIEGRNQRFYGSVIISPELARELENGGFVLDFHSTSGLHADVVHIRSVRIPAPPVVLPPPVVPPVTPQQPVAARTHNHIPLTWRYGWRYGSCWLYDAAGNQVQAMTDASCQSGSRYLPANWTYAVVNGFCNLLNADGVNADPNNSRMNDAYCNDLPESIAALGSKVRSKTNIPITYHYQNLGGQCSLINADGVAIQAMDYSACYNGSLALPVGWSYQNISGYCYLLNNNGANVDLNNGRMNDVYCNLFFVYLEAS